MMVAVYRKVTSIVMYQKNGKSSIETLLLKGAYIFCSVPCVTDCFNIL